MGKIWKLDVKMNQCYPKCGLGIFGGVLYLHRPHDRHTAQTERIREEIFGTGSWGGGWVEKRPRG